MEAYSELENKYYANNLPITKYLNFMKRYEEDTVKYHTVIGWDTFYANPETGLVLRHRRGKEGNDHPVLTFKKRKANGNSVDRHEVDLFLEQNETVDADAVAFVTALGAKPHFTILKESYIHHVKHGDVLAVLALYDVMTPKQYGMAHDSLQRFLEVEIDKVSSCTTADGRVALEWWDKELLELDIGHPIGKSLYELIGKTVGDAKLFVAGTF